MLNLILFYSFFNELCCIRVLCTVERIMNIFKHYLNYDVTASIDCLS